METIVKKQPQNSWTNLFIAPFLIISGGELTLFNAPFFIANHFSHYKFCASQKTPVTFQTHQIVWRSSETKSFYFGSAARTPADLTVSGFMLVAQ